MKKAIFIYNPLSGARFVVSKIGYVFEKFQKSNILIQPYILNASKQNELMELMQKESYDFAIVAGGDGSVSFVANILMKSGQNIPLGIIPAGTCNDFAKCINIPLKFEENLEVILNGNEKQVDIGLLNGERYFLNSYAGGVFADVSFKTDNEFKKNLGAFAYYIKALSEVKNIKSFQLNIKMPRREINLDAILFFITNGKSIAGFPNMVKKANLTDGMMNIAVIKRCSNIDLVSLFFKVLNGTWDKDSNVVFIEAKECFISANKDIQITVDGEKGEPLPAVIKFVNKGIKVFVK